MATNKKIVLTKDGLVTKIAELVGEKKTICGRVLDAYPQVVQDVLLNNLPQNPGEVAAIGLPGLGTLGVKMVPETVRKINFPGEDKGKEKVIPAHYTTTFKVTKVIKVALNADLVESASAAGKKAKKTA
jgi:nucleoid DNA-binding protein